MRLRDLNRFIILASAVLFFVQAAQADEAGKIAYNFYAGGLKGVYATLSMAEKGEAYEVETITQTQGFIGFIYPVKAVYSTEGKIVKDSLTPQSFITTSISRGKETRKELVYDEQGKVISKINVKKGVTSENEIVDEGGAGESLDYQSAVMMILRHLTDGGKCDNTFTVFDGKRRFSMVFTDKGLSEVPASDYSIFSGKARECLLTVEPKGGDYPTNSWFWHRSGKQGRQMPIKFWATRLKTGGPVMPVRIEIDSQGFGAIVAHLAEVM